jgi:predicted transcriptional regulator
MEKLEKKWDRIIEIIENTKESDFEGTLIVPLEDWNPSILSRKRTEILRVLKERDVRSEDELAKILKRKRPNVVNDLKLLEHYGLLKRVRVGKRVVPRIEKTEIIIY